MIATTGSPTKPQGERASRNTMNDDLMAWIEREVTG